MPLDIALSFLEGLALIVSPCILPVLPLVLGASVEGGRRRPFGIILGFVLAFTAFTMLSRIAVNALHLNLDYIKYGSLVLLALFGAVLLSERLSAKFSAFTQRFANAGSTLSANAGNGFGDGVLIGLLIGLVWTPCAGPILAAVLVQVIRQQSDIQAMLLIAAFALGAGVPMLLIALTGRKLMTRLGFFTRHAEGVRKSFGVIILLAVAFLATGIDPQSFFTKKEIASTAQATGLQDALPNPYPAPEFAGIDAWLNSQPLTMGGLKGKVVLVDFWTYSCINCIRTLPYITRWDKDYRSKGLVIIGVHAPEFEFEKSQANVEKALVKYGIDYPVALDNRLDTWTNFKNRYWPAHYLINQNGQVVYTHFGEGNYLETENNIRYLLGLDKKTGDAESPPSSRGQTPETYLGFARAARFAGVEPLKDTRLFTFPPSLPLHHWALSGTWRVEGQRITALQEGAALQLHFNAGKVFLVLGTATGKSVTVKLTLNGKKQDDVTVTEHRLYALADQGNVANAMLTITASAPGLEAYAFTFGK